MGDEKSASRLTELAQDLNRIDAARYPAIAAKNLSHLPPHLIEKLSTLETSSHTNLDASQHARKD